MPEPSDVAALADGRVPASEAVDHLLNRIGDVDVTGPALRSVIEVNPDARAIAAERDRERRDGRVRGPLHGVPVLVKDNIDTADGMLTTAGSYALAGTRPPADAPLVGRLRAAGAVLLGKTNLSEWANFRSPRSTSGWSARGGLTRNPWALDRNAGGSSSGSGAAVAAGLTPLAVGTETDGSIVCPASLNGVVGVKPTLGLVPTAGVVPVAHSQDVPGPMARTVREAALLLDVLAGSATYTGRAAYADACSATVAADALAGTRVGVARGWFGDHPGADAVVEAALLTLAARGAELVDPVDAPVLPTYDESDDELTVLLHEFRADLAAYLAGRPEGSPRSVDDVIGYNLAHADVELAWFGQELLEQAAACGPLDAPGYLAARDRAQAAARDGLDRALGAGRLDVLVAPTYGPAWKSDLVNGDSVSGGKVTAAPAVAGYPLVSVPVGFVHGLPVGLALVGAAGSEPVLLRVAHGVELAVGLVAAGALRPGFAATS